MALRDNHEHRVIASILHSRDAYEQISTDINLAEDFSQKGQVVVEKIIDYYNTDPDAPHVDRDFLIDQISMEHPAHASVFEATIKSLEPTSTPNALSEFSKLKLMRAKESLVEAHEANDTQKFKAALERVVYLEERGHNFDDSGEYVGTDIEEVIAAYQKENLIRIYPEALNDVLEGGVVPGTQIAVYAPTEVGKSMLAITMAAGFLRDGHKVLYIGNEDPAKAMLLRFYAHLSGMNKDEIIADPSTARELAFQNGYNNLVFKECSPGSLFDVKRAVDKYQPSIVMVDQMANMETRGNFTKVEKNEYLAARLRSIAKKDELVSVIIHQASEAAYGKTVLAKNDMYYSNVGVQGQMDVMIGIGMDDAMEQQQRRMLCLTKNKISSKHDNIMVAVDPFTSSVYNIGAG